MTVNLEIYKMERTSPLC